MFYTLVAKFQAKNFNRESATDANPVLGSATRVRLIAFLSRNRRIQRPDSSDGEFERITVGVAEVKRWRIVAKHNLSLTDYAVLLQTKTPGSDFLGLNSKSGVAGPSGAVRRKLSVNLRQIGAEEK